MQTFLGDVTANGGRVLSVISIHLPDRELTVALPPKGIEEKDKRCALTFGDTPMPMFANTEDKEDLDAQAARLEEQIKQTEADLEKSHQYLEALGKGAPDAIKLMPLMLKETQYLEEVSLPVSSVPGEIEVECLQNPHNITYTIPIETPDVMCAGKVYTLVVQSVFSNSSNSDFNITAELV